MTYQETAKIISMIKVYFPQSFKDADPASVVSAWTMALSDVPYTAVEAGLMCFVRTDTKGFPPSPGQLIDQIQKATSSEMTPGEAWTLLSRQSGTVPTEQRKSLRSSRRRSSGRSAALRH